MAKGAPMIDVAGLNQVSRALRQVNPELRRELFRDIGHMVKGRVTTAKKEARGAKVYGRSRGELARGIYLTKAGSKRDIGSGAKRGLFSFVAISAAPYSNILSYVNGGTSKLGSTMTERYGQSPRFLAGAFLGPGSGGGDMWAESRDIVEKYIARLNEQIETNSKSSSVSIGSGGAVIG